MTWESLSTGTLDDILGWCADQSWSRDMAECQQEKDWHAEGDVWTHTQMVSRQLPLLEDWSSLTLHEQTVLIFTAIFHDSGKPLTSRLDPTTGRITSPKHALRGEHLARAALRELGCPLAVREEIARMVRCHGRPVFLLEKPDPHREVITHSWWVSNRLLYLFTLADTRGRHTAETTRPEENLHLWKMVAEENDCFEQPYRFPNDHARFLYFRRPDSNRFYVPHEDYRCTVTMMSGLPGGGKDWWLSHRHPDLPTVSLDDLRAELGISPTEDQGEVIGLARERCRELLRARTSFAFNATNVLRLTRERWIDLFADYGARIEMIYLRGATSVDGAAPESRTLTPSSRIGNPRLGRQVRTTHLGRGTPLGSERGMRAYSESLWYETPPPVPCPDSILRLWESASSHIPRVR